MKLEKKLLQKITQNILFKEVGCIADKLKIHGLDMPSERESLMRILSEKENET